MEIKQLDPTNARLVMEILAIHCVYPQQWQDADDEQPWSCVPRNLAQLESARPNLIYYVQDHGRVVAICWLVVLTRRTGTLRSLWVDPAYRRRGIAKQLLSKADRWFSAQQVTSIEVAVPEPCHEMKGLLQAYAPTMTVLTKQPLAAQRNHALNCV